MKYAIGIRLVATCMFAAGCPAPLNGAPCPCLSELGYVCSEELGVCVPINDNPSIPDAALADAQNERPGSSQDAGDSPPPDAGDSLEDATSADATGR